MEPAPREPAAAKSPHRDLGGRHLGWAIGIGTVVQAASFFSFMIGVFASTSEEAIAGGPAFALGFILVPVACATVAFVSRHPQAPMATLKGMGGWLVVALPLSLMNPIIGLSAGFAASGALTLRSDSLQPGSYRLLAIAGTAAYVVILILILPQAAMVAGALTPLLAIRVGDLLTEQKEKAQETS